MTAGSLPLHWAQLEADVPRLLRRREQILEALREVAATEPERRPRRVAELADRHLALRSLGLLERMPPDELDGVRAQLGVSREEVEELLAAVRDPVVLAAFRAVLPASFGTGAVDASVVELERQIEDTHRELEGAAALVHALGTQVAKLLEMRRELDQREDAVQERERNLIELTARVERLQDDRKQRTARLGRNLAYTGLAALLVGLFVGLGLANLIPR